MQLNSSRSRGARPARAILLVALIGTSIAGIVAFGGRGDAFAGEPDPTDRPSAPVVTPAPGDGGGDAMPIKVDLETLTPHDVHVDVVDRSELLVDAASGTPTASASVEAGRLVVENVDPKTLRLTWLDRPGDNALALTIVPTDEGLDLVLVQPEHDLDGDSILHDRVLILEFAEDVSADDVVGTLRAGAAA
jgi:hypothetical protein